MRNVLFGFGMLSIGIILLVTGCSKSTDSEIDTDSLAESMKSQTNMMVYTMSSLFDDGFYYTDFDGYNTKPADTSYSSYDVQTYWWTFIDERTLSIEGSVWAASILDSVRFSAGDSYQQFPNDLTDVIDIHTIGEDILTFTADSSIGNQYDIDFEFGNVNGDTIDIDGTFDNLIEITMGDFEFDYDFVCAFQNIKIVETPGSSYLYPLDGVMTMDVMVTSNSNLSIDIPAGAWTISVQLEFNENGYSGSMTIEGNSYTWTTVWSDISQMLPFDRP